MNHTRAAAGVRIGVVLMSAVAWFSISNHCALGALEPKAGAVHAACHGSPVGPTKSPPKEPTPCCKSLRATVVQPIAAVTQIYFSGLPGAWPDATIVFPERSQSHEFFELDTGPPFIESFAERVLQRSILAHAPPSVLS